MFAFLTNTIYWALQASPCTISPMLTLQKFAGPRVGPLFCGGPCSAEHAEHAWIHMCKSVPKFASGWQCRHKPKCPPRTATIGPQFSGDLFSCHLTEQQPSYICTARAQKIFPINWLTRRLLWIHWPLSFWANLIVSPPVYFRIALFCFCLQTGEEDNFGWLYLFAYVVFVFISVFYSLSYHTLPQQMGYSAQLTARLQLKAHLQAGSCSLSVLLNKPYYCLLYTSPSPRD